MSDSAYAQRRQYLAVESFEQIMDQALRPLADPRHQPECFYEGYRLVGIDGTQWSVSNTPALVSALPKAASRRLQAAFAKLRLVSVVDLGTHAPLAGLAAAVSESEQVLAADWNFGDYDRRSWLSQRIQNGGTCPHIARGATRSAVNLQTWPDL